MPLRSRIIIVFLISIIISVFVFMITTFFLLKSTLWGGEINEQEMKRVAEKVIGLVLAEPAFDRQSIKPILEAQARQGKGMQFDLLDNQLQVIYSTTGQSGPYPLENLLTRLSNHGIWGQQEWVITREIRQNNELKGYLVVSVPKEDYQALVIAVNSRGAGLLGQIGLIGIIITLLVSSIFAMLFTFRISKRFSQLNREIAMFELGNLAVKVNDNAKDEIGKLAYVFNTMTANIKNQVEKEKALQEERRVLVSSISHDLRTPLTSIVGYAESLEKNMFDGREELVKRAGIIRKSALHMDGLLDELLYFLKYEFGDYKIHKQSADIAELCREIIIEYLPVLKERDMELVTAIPDEPLEIPIDVGNLTRVLRNLIENAVKYGAEGRFLGVKIDKCSNMVMIAVIDHGPGIAGDHPDKVFERFYRGNKSRNSRIGGMGLGLSISKDIIAGHGGKLKVDSQPWIETKFTIELPL